MDPFSFQTLLDEFSVQAQSERLPNILVNFHDDCYMLLFCFAASIPLSVKREVTTLIRQYLDKQFE
jgi:hypothetical protein